MWYIKEIFIDIYYILSGYVNLILSKMGFGSPLYKERNNVCKGCPKMKRNVCTECGCWIPAKVCSEYPVDNEGKSIGGCPDGKW